MSDDLDEILDRAQKTTDDQLRGDIAKLTSCSEADLKRILPADLDPEQFARLMAICRDETLTNEKKAKAIGAIAGLTEMAVGLAAKIAKA